MMRCARFACLVLPLACLVALPGTVQGAQGELVQLGVGANYYRSVNDTIHEDFDEDGVGWSISTRIFSSSPVHFGLEVEQFPDNYAGLAEDTYAPSLYLIAGRCLYAGLGAGMYYYDGTLYSDLFYTLRAGIMLELLPSLYLDINGNYRFEDIGEIQDELRDVDTDTVTLGAAVRIGF